MTSLQKLLMDEGFTKSHKNVRFCEIKTSNSHTPDHEFTALLPIYICQNRKSFDNKTSSRKGSSVVSSKKSHSLGEPAIDEVAVKAVVTILSGYIGRFVKDEDFREFLREKCYSVLKTEENRGLKSEIFMKFESGIESIERLVEKQEEKKEIRMKLLRNSISLLTVVASLNTKTTKKSSTCGVPNSQLSACAQLYLSIVYKIQKNDRISSRHLLQVFCDSPFLARAHLLPDLWEHFFLPHLLHLKIWYTKEIEFLSELEFEEKEKKMKCLNKVYNEQMDSGTVKFATYYKNWLKVGCQSLSVPIIPLPSRPEYKHSKRLSSGSLTPPNSMNESLYRTVFGATRPDKRSMDFDNRNQASTNTWDFTKVEKTHFYENNCITNENSQPSQHKIATHRRTASQTYRSPKAEIWPETQKSDRFRFFSCRSEQTDVGPNNSVKRIEKWNHFPNDFTKAITIICSSDSLHDCELSIRVIIKTWLELNGDVAIEKALSKATIIEGMLEILFSSNEDEILELTISILAELVTRNKANGDLITNSDPQLEIFMRLMRSSSLFLKASILLYMVKPKASQLISIEWVPLVLRVLQFGDQLQILLSVRCSPYASAYYILDQLLTGFDEDKNLEKARQVVNMGGLGLLVKRFEKGDVNEKAKIVLVIFCCIRADGGCRHYLATNLDKGSIVELLVSWKLKNVSSLGFELLNELLCLSRRTEALRFLKELLNGWRNINTMHILFSYLQKADPEERPIVAAMLFQLDLLGDPMKCSIYREEVIDTIIEGLECDKCNKNVQEQVARALYILGGRFSYKGQATIENWVLEESGFNKTLGYSFQKKDVELADSIHSNIEEDGAMQNWQMNTAIAILTCGKKRFLSALCDCIVNAIPCLARASLITIAWTSCYIDKITDKNYQYIACSVLVPHLVQSSDHDRVIEERVIASFSLLSLAKCTGFWSEILPIYERRSSHLQDLSQVTWTARELMSLIRRTSKRTLISGVRL